MATDLGCLKRGDIVYRVGDFTKAIYRCKVLQANYLEDGDYLVMTLDGGKKGIEAYGAQAEVGITDLFATRKAAKEYLRQQEFVEMFE